MPAWASGDHPRSRGVYGGVVPRLLQREGSSPLARGLRERHGRGHPGRGIIPARAGFTRWRRGAYAPLGDHPRSRGVYPTTTRPWWAAAGSSPLARGLPATGPSPRPAGRIIPARAGFTCGAWAPPPRRRDHPRSRGVYSPSTAPPSPSPGSSPLARGLRFDGELAARPLGIIPARAGFTPWRRG